MRLDDVLTWLVRATGLEPKLLSIAGILVAYVAALVANHREAGLLRREGVESPDLDGIRVQLDRIEGLLAEAPAGLSISIPDSWGKREADDDSIPEPEVQDDGLMKRVVGMTTKAGRTRG